MIDELREEAIVNKVGGRFKLSTLIQKRMVALNAGSRPLVDTKSDNKLEIVIQEIIQDKIYLDTSSNLKVTGQQPADGGPPVLDLANLFLRELPEALAQLEVLAPSQKEADDPTMQGREIVVGISGGIAAYKTAALVSRLVQDGAGVTVVMTAAAREFIGPATLAALTGRPVLERVFADGDHPLGAHIDLAERADLVCVAPATANLLAKAAQGLADDLLSTLLLSFAGPVLLAPAMNCEMWEKPAVQRNVAQLRADGLHFVGPEEGWLSCRKRGQGRMSEPTAIYEAIAKVLASQTG